ncbi:MAG: terpene cyclase/mutase family protein, partial [Methylosarcina sp.]
MKKSMPHVKPAWKNWQLLTEKGRQLWAFKPDSKHLNDHLHHADDVSDEEIAGFNEDFQFDSFSNPNSGDKVYRNSAIGAKYREFVEQIPHSPNP